MNKEIVNPQKLNPALMIPAAGCIPIVSYEEYDKEQKIYSGKVLLSVLAPRVADKLKDFKDGEIYFSRKYDKDKSVDGMLFEYEIKMKGRLAKQFPNLTSVLFIPMDKVIFGYQKASILDLTNLTNKRSNLKLP